MRPHEVLNEIVQYCSTIPRNVRSEIALPSPRGFAASAALQRLRHIILLVDKLDSKYDQSLKLTDPSRTAAGDGLQQTVVVEEDDANSETVVTAIIPKAHNLCSFPSFPSSTIPDPSYSSDDDDDNWPW